MRAEQPREFLIDCADRLPVRHRRPNQPVHVLHGLDPRLDDTHPNFTIPPVPLSPCQLTLYNTVVLDVCTGTPPYNGVLGNAQWPFNDGFVPILIDNSHLTDCAASFGFPRDVLKAQDVAHETGHRLGISHPHREAPYTPFADFSAASLTLPAGEYTSTTPAVAPVTAYVWLGQYAFGSNTFKSEALTIDGGILSATSYSPGGNVYVTPARDAAVVSMTIPTTISLAAIPPDVMWVSVQEQHIMDWSPRLTLINMANWTFNPRDLLNMCAAKRCY